MSAVDELVVAGEGPHLQDHAHRQRAVDSREWPSLPKFGGPGPRLRGDRQPGPHRQADASNRPGTAAIRPIRSSPWPWPITRFAPAANPATTASPSDGGRPGGRHRVAGPGSRLVARHAARAAPALAWHHANRSGAAVPTSTRRQGRRVARIVDDTGLIAIGVDRSVWLDARGEDGPDSLAGPVQRARVHVPVRRPVEPFRPVLPVANAGLGQRAARPPAARAGVGARPVQKMDRSVTARQT